jgi:flagellin-like hook-associated protein FlgL
VGAPTPFVGVYNDDTDPTSGLIVDFDPVFSASQNVLEQVLLADYNAGDRDRTNAVYKLMPDGSTEEFLSYGAVYDAAPTGTQFIDNPRWSAPAVPATIDEKEAEVGVNDLENDQYRFTEVFNTTTTTINPNDNTWTVTDYRQHAGGDDGVYAWGAGSYTGGVDDVKIQNAASGEYRTHEHHILGDSYNWDIAGTNFASVTIEGTTVSAANGLAYNAGDIKLEKVDIANNAEGDALVAAGNTVFYRNFGAENQSAAFYVRIENENGIRYDLDPSEWEKNELDSYMQREKLGYNRKEIAFYTREIQIGTQEISSGTAQVYDGEDVDTNATALVGYERSEDTNGLSQNFIPHWTTFDGRVEFGSTFQITDTENGTLIDSNLAQGTYTNTSVSRDIPTPPVEEIAESNPEYGTFVDLFGNPGNPDVQNRDDAVNVGVVDNVNGDDELDYSDPDTPDVSVGLVSGGTVTDPFSGNAMELFTGELEFEDDAAFGIYHGPAVVSDQFRAEQGQFLRLNYTAAGDIDHYHVAGYIYKINEANGEFETDENGDAKITMALSETGEVELNGRASVEIEEGGEYRFVFVVGTFDKTGGMAAGASMRIDNIVAEFPYSISEEAVAALLQSVHYRNDDTVSSGTKTVTSTLRNTDDSHLLTDDAVINLEGFTSTAQSDGPYMLAPTLNLVTTPSEGSSGSASVLTSKIEVVQERLNKARVQAGSQYAVLEEAINITTDLRSQFAQGSGTISDLNFSIETVNLTRRQMQQNVATTVLAQANKTQSSLVTLVDGSYRTYLNGQFSHLR